ncbi:hypothetical protein BC940DRAFT_13700 [Gongronella butleri]|nr:hypothetical protein BC940DRAFT_13700 [Gongronella butleri]
MQREPTKKTYTLSHERFVLDIDPYHRFIEGSAELTIQPLAPLTSVRINSRLCEIVRTFVNGETVHHDLTDPVSGLTLGATANIAHHQVYKTKYLNALRDADEGELAIRIPDHCIKKMTASEAQLVSNQIYLEPTVTDDQLQPGRPAPSEPVYAPIILRIDFRLEDPRAGIVFVEPEEDVAPHRAHHLYTVNQPLPGATRAWLPCIDHISERCTWDMEFVVPRRMGKVSGASGSSHGDTTSSSAQAVANGDDSKADDAGADGDGDSSMDTDATVVICSGEIVDQVIHPKDPSKKIVRYNLSVPTAAPFIGFAIGPFEMIKLSPSQLQEEVLNASELDESQQQSLMAEINMMSNIYAFALPGYKDELNVSCTFLMHAMHFYAQEYGSYPFSDFKLVFVDVAWSDTVSSASLAICSSRLLHDASIIDQVYSTRQALSFALARQWFGVHITQKTWMDTWLILGLANHMGALFIKRHLGNNEYRLRLKKDMDLCCALDVNRPPLYNAALPSPLDPDDLQFMELKAPLVLFILDRRMCKAGATLGLSRVLPKILVSAMSGELPQNAISTHYFMRLCRKISGFDTKQFAEQWVYKSGCPRFNFSFNFNRKKMVVELYMKQQNSNSVLASKDGAHAATAMDGISSYQGLVCPLFTGNLTVRIHEADGTPYEHILDIQSNEHKYEVQFNTKYKRIRRNTKRFRAKQAAAAAAVAEEEQEQEEAQQGEPGTTSVLGIIPTLGLGMPIFEDPEKKEEWHVREWGQESEDTSGAASTIFDWIRLDAEFEWLTAFDFEQPDYMWAAQLTKDRDVVAQHEALQALVHMPSVQTSTSLLRALLDQKCFYKIRMEAAYALATCATPSLHWVGLLQLGKMFQRRYCFPLSSSHEMMDIDDGVPLTPAIPKPNNFSNLQDYFIQKSVVIALSRVRGDDGLTPIKVRQCLLDLLRYNDNLGNEFSDSYYIATMISALGDSLIPATHMPDALDHETIEGWELIDAAKNEIERFRTLDYVMPTYHNVVTIACLKTICKLMVHGLIEMDLNVFLPYTRYGNYMEVRLTAIDSVLVLAGLTHNEINNYLVSIIKDDPSVYVSHYVSRAMLMWLGLALRDGAHVSAARAAEEFAEQEGQTMLQEERDRMAKTAYQDFLANVDKLRDRFEKNDELQQNLWDLINSPENITIDHSIRKYLLQFCEFMFKPIDIGLKVTIRVPAITHDPTEDMSEPPSPVSQPVIRLSKKQAKKDAAEETKPTSTIRSFVTETNGRSSSVVSSPSSESSSPSSPVAPSLPSVDVTPTSVKAPPSPVITAPTPQKPSPSQPASSSSTTQIAAQATPATKPAKPAKPAKPTKPVSVTPPKPVVSTTSTAPVALSASPQPVPRPRTDKDICSAILYKVMQSSHAFEFLRPVDPIKQGIPHYFDIIKKPMDLGTIKSKLKSNQYLSVKQFDDDIRLMLNNCYNFNPPDTYVYNEAKALEDTYNAEYKTYFGSSTSPVSATSSASSSSTATPATATTQTPTIAAPPAPQKAPKPSTKQTPVTPPGKPVVAPISAPNAPTPAKPTKPAKPTPAAAPAPAPAPASASASVSAPAPVQTPPKSTTRTAHRNPVRPAMDDDNVDICGRIIKELWNQPEALPFHYPLDVVALNIPTYLEFIKRPMDFSTVRSNLYQGKFKTIWDFERDVRQIFWNCFRFNDPSSLIHQQAVSVQSHFNDLWHEAYAEPGFLAGDDDALAKKLLSNLMKREHAQLFLEPVDTTILPDYADKIKEPMDLRTISEKLYSGRYTSLAQFDADFRLMISNCYAYNHPKSFACEQAKALDQYYHRCSQGKEIRNRIKAATDATTSNSASNVPAAAPSPLSSSPASSTTSSPAKTVSAPPRPSPKAATAHTSPAKPAPVKPVPAKSAPATPARPHAATTTTARPLPTTVAPHAPPGNVPMVVPLSTTPAKLATHLPLTPTAPTSASTASSAVSASTAASSIPSQAATTTSTPSPSSQQRANTSAAAASSLPTPAPPTGKLLPGLHTRLDVLLSKLKRHKHAFAFLQPVDPVALGIPHYTTIVQHPMDLSTMSKKLKAGGYKTLKDFETDFRLIVTNCILFNGPDHPVSLAAKELETVFNKDMQTIRAKEEQILRGQLVSAGATKATKSAAKKPQGPTMRADVKKYKQLLDKLRSKEYYPTFALPVDPVALGIPTYPDYVKHPMDLSTIHKKLEKYKSAAELLDDVKQMIVNCYLFNLPDDRVYGQGRMLEADFQRMCMEKGLATIHIDMDNERAKAEAEGAILQDLSYFENTPYLGNTAPIAGPTATSTTTNASASTAMPTSTSSSSIGAAQTHAYASTNAYASPNMQQHQNQLLSTINPSTLGKHQMDYDGSTQYDDWKKPKHEDDPPFM